MLVSVGSPTFWALDNCFVACDLIFLSLYVHDNVVSFFYPDTGATIFSPANLSTEQFSTLLSEHPSGVYFGWAGLPTRGVFKMVMSIGWNPYFNNAEKTIVSVLKHTTHPLQVLFFVLISSHCNAGAMAASWLWWGLLWGGVASYHSWVHTAWGINTLEINQCLRASLPISPSFVFLFDILVWNCTGQFPISRELDRKDPWGQENCRGSSWSSNVLKIQRWPIS